MSAFHLKRAVNYGYFRPAGVYTDLSPADQSALAKYGAPVPSTEDASPASLLPDGHVSEDGSEGLSVFEPAPKEESHVEAPATRPDDATERPPNTEQVKPPVVDPLACPRGCRDGKPFKSAKALQAHRTQEKH